MHNWMSYGNGRRHPGCDQSFGGRSDFSHRFENGRYFMYQSMCAAELENAIKKCHINADVGPSYIVDPVLKSDYANNIFTPAEKELVLDIDISRYDDVRYCCSGGDICSLCWPLMMAAMQVIDRQLTDVYNFKHILWVYSGHSSVHCWVCDEDARRMSDLERCGIAENLKVPKGGNNPGSFTQCHPLKRHQARAYAGVLKYLFSETYVEAQQLFSHEEKYEKILDLIPDKSIASMLREKWKAGRSRRPIDINMDRWDDVRRVPNCLRMVVDIVFHFTYPRLSLEISEEKNQYLRVPFGVNPETGRVSVPIDPKNCEQFDPYAVPTLTKLAEELNMGCSKANSNIVVLEKSSLGKSLKYFRSSFLNPLLGERT